MRTVVLAVVLLGVAVLAGASFVVKAQDPGAVSPKRRCDPLAMSRGIHPLIPCQSSDPDRAA